ncbi:Sensor histidine kinase RcsC [Thalassocella blandensis]|nr:Sensor histidine kinase RcsC [Thalassocella blandensis]
MFSFFLPTSKVQKDRHIMRETDARMAKYSRRGLIVNFLAFLVILFSGRFFEENHDLMIFLTIGLLLITLLRGFLLFRFEHLYPRAPAKWRNRYFVATLLGGIWWGIILSSVTLKLGMQGEAPLFWIYTVIFFSTTAHAFAPYQKFLAYYQFVGQVPAGIIAISLGDLNSVLYGVMLLVFYLVLTHQCRLISENYWEKLEATYALARKTQSIEEEKRDTRANVKLNAEFMNLLHSDIDRILSHVSIKTIHDPNVFKERIQSELSDLYGNIRDFHGVLSKELDLRDSVFNIRHEIQHLVAEFIDDAERKDIQIETALSPNLPLRLKGDASRLAQVIRTLLDMTLTSIEKCIILVEVEFLREYETAGELYVTVTRTQDKNKKRFFADDSAPIAPEASLSLVVAKGLAELMNGSIEVNEGVTEEHQFRFNAKIDIAEIAGQLDFHKDSFSGHNVLLMHNSPRIVDLKRQELDALGFNVFTETQYKRALQTLQNSYKYQNPIESLIFYLEPDNQSVVAFCEAILEIPELKFTHKIVAATRKQQIIMRKNGFDENNGFFYVDKPTGLFELESIFHQIYKQGDASEKQDDSTLLLPFNVQTAVLTAPGKMDQKLESTLEKLGDSLTVYDALPNLINKIKDDECQIVIIDSDNFDNIAEVVREIRSAEKSLKKETLLPVIGLSVTEKDVENSAYELGLDDFIDLVHNPKKTLVNTIGYWATLI